LAHIDISTACADPVSASEGFEDLKSEYPIMLLMMGNLNLFSTSKAPEPEETCVACKGCQPEGFKDPASAHAANFPEPADTKDRAIEAPDSA
jgi:hypothetical protein